MPRTANNLNGNYISTWMIPVSLLANMTVTRHVVALTALITSLTCTQPLPLTASINVTSATNMLTTVAERGNKKFLE